MILGSYELDKFVVEPWMELKPFDPKLIKEIIPDHPYKILLRILFKYYKSFSNCDFLKNNYPDSHNECYEDTANFYFKMLDDYNRYGIAFNSKLYLFPDNKLCVSEFEDFGKQNYVLVDNDYDSKYLLFNKIKKIDLNDIDRGKKPLTKEEKIKRDLIKKLPNKKLQIALMDPDFYNNDEIFKGVFNNYRILKDETRNTFTEKILIEKFNNRMTFYGLDDFLRIKY